MTNPKMPLLVLGIAIGGLTLASHGLLTSQVGDVDERPREVEQQQELWVPPVVVPSVGPRYTGGVSTVASLVAAPIEVTAPDGSVLRGIVEADLTIGRVVVVSDDSSVRPATERIDLGDFEFDTGGFDGSDSVTSRILLELHGWPEERWPEGWSPR